MILLVILVILAALVLFAVRPGAKREDLRAPFYGRNYAHRGYFPARTSARRKTACLLFCRRGPPRLRIELTYSLRLTISWWFSTMIRWTA